MTRQHWQRVAAGKLNGRLLDKAQRDFDASNKEKQRNCQFVAFFDSAVARKEHARRGRGDTRWPFAPVCVCVFPLRSASCVLPASSPVEEAQFEGAQRGESACRDGQSMAGGQRAQGKAAELREGRQRGWTNTFECKETNVVADHCALPLALPASRPPVRFASLPPLQGTGPKSDC
jgi:hypothetical protein